MKYKKLAVAAIVAAILVSSALVYFYLVETKPETNKSDLRKSITGVHTDVANYQNHVVSIEYPGRVAAREIVSVTPEVGGKIIPGDVSLKTGVRFKKGDTIVKIYSEDAKASLASEKSVFLNTLASALPDIKVDFPEEFDKWMSFFKQVDLDKDLPKLPSLNSDKEKIYISTKNILSSYYNIIQSEIVLSRYEIKAPFNGIFTSVNREVGSIASSSVTIAEIVSTDVLEITVGVFLTDAQNLRIGTEVIITSKSGKEYTGRINRIASFVDPTTQRVNVYVVFSEPSLEIVEGQMLMVRMPSQDIEGTIEVFRSALVGDSLIYVVQDSVIVSKPVELVITNTDKSYIKGLEEGERFVNESLVSPYEGMEVFSLDMNGKQL
ncbi:MAG: efflux RND transporter periplasmic adaptor subunit [Rikenellaceae bacterium]